MTKFCNLIEHFVRSSAINEDNIESKCIPFWGMPYGQTMIIKSLLGRETFTSHEGRQCLMINVDQLNAYS